MSKKKPLEFEKIVEIEDCDKWLIVLFAFILTLLNCIALFLVSYDSDRFVSYAVGIIIIDIVITASLFVILIQNFPEKKVYWREIR